MRLNFACTGESIEVTLARKTFLAGLRTHLKKPGTGPDDHLQVIPVGVDGPHDVHEILGSRVDDS